MRGVLNFFNNDLLPVNFDQNIFVELLFSWGKERFRVNRQYFEFSHPQMSAKYKSHLKIKYQLNQTLKKSKFKGQYKKSYPKLSIITNI